MQQKKTFVHHCVLSCVCSAVILALLVPADASASYTIINDDSTLNTLEPSPAPAQLLPQHFTIPFRKQSTLLTRPNHAILDNLLAQFPTANIRIVGRPDNKHYSGRLSSIARNRAINIRNYLTRRGISSKNIAIQTDTTSNIQDDDGRYSSDIYITSLASTLVPTANTILNRPLPEDELSHSSSSTVPKHYQAPGVQPNFVSPSANQSGSNSDQLVKLINSAVQSGQLQPTVALSLLQALMQSDFRAPLQPGTTPTQLIQPQLRNNHWVLDKGRTLRSNIDSWLTTSGWNPSIWDASSDFQVTKTSFVDGPIPDVLSKISDMTGLNFCVKPHLKTVRITDALVPCQSTNEIGAAASIQPPVYTMNNTSVSYSGDVVQLLSNVARALQIGFHASGHQTKHTLFVQINVRGVTMEAFLAQVADKLGQDADIEFAGNNIELIYR